MHRFFVNHENIYPDHILIKSEDVKHIKNVLRLKPGDEVVICDGDGTDYSAVITGYEVDGVAASIVKASKSQSEPVINVTLFQGIPKSDKMDFIIQKSVELGVKRIVPLITERTVVRLKDKREVGKKTERWNRISLEAAKQSGRGRIPQVAEPVEFCSAMELCRNMDFSVIPYENCKEPGLKEHLQNCNGKNIAVIIGPEGGFTNHEIEQALLSGIMPVTLGPRILRTETAALAVMAILMYEKGEMGTALNQE